MSPYIVLYHIPVPGGSMSQTTDEIFRRLFLRFAYLTSEPNFRRVSAFKQSTGFSRDGTHYLLLQEFDEFERSSLNWRALKKCEAEYWWRKHEHEGVRVEFEDSGV